MQVLATWRTAGVQKHRCYSRSQKAGASAPPYAGMSRNLFLVGCCNTPKQPISNFSRVPQAVAFCQDLGAGRSIHQLVYVPFLGEKPELSLRNIVRFQLYIIVEYTLPCCRWFRFTVTKKGPLKIPLNPKHVQKPKGATEDSLDSKPYKACKPCSP